MFTKATRFVAILLIIAAQLAALPHGTPTANAANKSRPQDKPCPADYCGWAAHYSPNVMEGVVEVRRNSKWGLPVSPDNCYIATHVGRQGMKVRVTNLHTGKSLVCIKADWPQVQHYDCIVWGKGCPPKSGIKPVKRSKGWVRLAVELGFPAAQTLCGVTAKGSRNNQHPPHACPVSVTILAAGIPGAPGLPPKGK